MDLVFGIVVGLIVAGIVGFFVWKGKHTDWKALDEANKVFLDKDGNHAYYDRHR